jgi:hypothetical protein
MKQLATSLIILVLLGSCAGSRHGNFSRQKFTELKSFKYSEETAVVAETFNDQSDKPTVNYYGHAQETLNAAETFGEVLAPDQTTGITTPENEIEPSENVIEIRKTSSRENSDDPVSSTDRKSKNASAEDFDSLYRSAAMLFVLFALFMVMAFFAISPYMFFVCAFTSPILFFGSWILGIFLAFRSQKVPKDERNKLYKLKAATAWTVALLGVVAIPVAGLLFTLWLIE